MRALLLASLILLPVVSSAEDCQEQQVALVRRIHSQVYGTQSILLRHVMGLQKDEKTQDAEELRVRCEKIRAAVDSWEHSSHGTPKENWQGYLDAQKSFSKYMLEVINRDRAAWDRSLANMKANGLQVETDYKNFVITVTKVLAQDGQSVQQIKTVMDFCGPETVDGDNGRLTSEIQVRAKERGAKTVSLSPRDYALANLPAECGVPAREGTEFLKTSGALRSSKSASALPSR